MTQTANNQIEQASIAAWEAQEAADQAAEEAIQNVTLQTECHDPVIWTPYWEAQARADQAKREFHALCRAAS